jgi:hypothetical protein
MVLKATPVPPPSRSPGSGSPAAGTPGTRRRDDARHATEKSRRPAPPPCARPAPCPSARPAQPPGVRPSPAETGASLPDRGIPVLLVFVAATLIMVAGVTLVGAVDQWWILAPVMLVDFILTFIVIALILELLGEGA